MGSRKEEKKEHGCIRAARRDEEEMKMMHFELELLPFKR
jgi:hypothetical protein